MRSPRLRLFISVLALATVYTLVAKVGLMMGPVAGFATLVWPPSGIALAALLVLGLPAWPGVALGAFAVNLWIGGPIPVAAGIALGNTLEAVVGAYALRNLAGFDRELDRLRDVLSLVVLAGLFSTLLSASIGVGTWPRPAHRQGNRRSARRQDLGRELHRSGQHLLLQPAPGGIGSRERRPPTLPSPRGSWGRIKEGPRSATSSAGPRPRW